MKIVYNPENGQDCANYLFEKSEIEGIKTGELKQYEDLVAEDMIERWGFLQILTADEAKKIIEKPKAKEFKCQYCNKEFDIKLALSGHMSTHKAEIEEAAKPAMDPNIIPIAGSTQVSSATEASQPKQIDPTTNGTDRDGVEWYGDGVKEQNSSLAAVTPIGVGGHFGAA